MHNEAPPVTTPPAIMGLYDGPMWESIASQNMSLQCCASCNRFRYPPGPVCDQCLSPDYIWTPISGQGTVVSWAIFHRTYLPAYPQPYNVIAVRLDEGPLMISNLEGATPEGTWIGARVKLVYTTMADGIILPRFILER